MMEMRAVLATLVQRLDMRFADGYDSKSYAKGLKDMFTVQAGCLSVVVSERTT